MACWLLFCRNPAGTCFWSVAIEGAGRRHRGMGCGDLRRHGRDLRRAEKDGSGQRSLFELQDRLLEKDRRWHRAMLSRSQTHPDAPLKIDMLMERWNRLQSRR